MRPGILPEHGFKHKGNHYASLPRFGTKIAQKYAIKGSKYSGFRRDVSRDVKPHVLTFSTSGQRQVTTFCTCAVTSRKKCHVSGCRRQAGDVCCLRCLMQTQRPTDHQVLMPKIRRKQPMTTREPLHHAIRILFSETEITLILRHHISVCNDLS